MLTDIITVISLARYANIFGTNLRTRGDRSSSIIFAGKQWRLVWLSQILRRLSQFCRKRLLPSSCLSVRLFAWNNSAPTGLISMNFHIWLFLDVFEKFLKTTIYLVMSVYMSFRMEQLGSQRTDFHKIWYFKIFMKSEEKIQNSLKPVKNKGYCTWRRNVHLSVLLRMRCVSEKNL